MDNKNGSTILYWCQVLSTIIAIIALCYSIYIFVASNKQEKITLLIQREGNVKTFLAEIEVDLNNVDYYIEEKYKDENGVVRNVFFPEYTLDNFKLAISQGWLFQETSGNEMLKIYSDLLKINAIARFDSEESYRRYLGGQGVNFFLNRMKLYKIWALGHRKQLEDVKKLLDDYIAKHPVKI